mgnify:FL=1
MEKVVRPSPARGETGGCTHTPVLSPIVLPPRPLLIPTPIKSGLLWPQETLLLLRITRLLRGHAASARPREACRLRVQGHEPLLLRRIKVLQNRLLAIILGRSLREDAAELLRCERGREVCEVGT